MKYQKLFSHFAAAAILFTAISAAADQPTEEAPGRGGFRRHRFDQNSPEAHAARLRRHEIMILFQAYRIVDEDLKQGLKREILKRLRDDYIANREVRERAINFFARELERLRAQQQTNSPEEIDSLLEAEFIRLENMPADMFERPRERHRQGNE